MLVLGKLKMTAACMLLFGVGVALSQENKTITLPADTGKFTVGGLSYKTMGVIGSHESTASRFSTNTQAAENAVPAIPAPGFYPGDVTNPGNGPTIQTVLHHPIYVDNVPSHWGDVGGFLKDLGRSDFIHLVDQYVGLSADNRYKMGTSFVAPTYPIPSNHTLGISDILALVHAGAQLAGNGYTNIYHVFLPLGVDICLHAQITQCYSPDNPSTFYFCAFHGSVDFSDAVGHVLFSVEPYQDVPGCSVPPTGTANSQLVDSTDNVLSHETFEAISDPDGTAWWVQDYTALSGAEIGDICTRAGQFPTGFYWNYGEVRLRDHRYTIQPEYSNTMHGCAYGPFGSD